MSERPLPVGVVLAGGLGRRIGGAKALVELGGRPLISYPLAALQSALPDVAIVAKPDTALPAVPGVPVWREPAEPRHPVVGLVEALTRAGSRGVLVCAADMPFVTPQLIGALAQRDPGGAPAVLIRAGGELQPLLGCYRPRALAPLAEAAAASELAPLRALARTLSPVLFELQDPDEVFNVNGPEDLELAAAMLARRSATRT